MLVPAGSYDSCEDDENDGKAQAILLTRGLKCIWKGDRRFGWLGLQLQILLIVTSEPHLPRWLPSEHPDGK